MATATSVSDARTSTILHQISKFLTKKLGVPKFFLNLEFLAQKIRKIKGGWNAQKISRKSANLNYVQKKFKFLNILIMTKKGGGGIIKKYHKKVQILIMFKKSANLQIFENDRI